MTETVRKKGLSKGCTVALIVGGAAVVLIAAVVILLMFKWGDVANWAMKMAVQNEKRSIMSGQLAGIDTVMVNGIADSFLERLESEELDYEKLAPFSSFIQKHATDQKVDSAEAVAFVAAMIAVFPDLSNLEIQETTSDTTAVIDTTLYR